MASESMSTSEIIIEALLPMEFSQGLDSCHLTKLATMATQKTFEEGDIIFQEGDTGKMIYLVQDGCVAIYISVPGRGRVTILTVKSGRLLGWSSLFPPHHRMAGARAMLPTRVIAIDAAQLWKACNADHDLGYTVMCRVAEAITSRLIATRLQLLDMFVSTSRRSL